MIFQSITKVEDGLTDLLKLIRQIPSEATLSLHIMFLRPKAAANWLLDLLPCIKHPRTKPSHNEYWFFWFMDWGPGLVSKAGMHAKGNLWRIRLKNLISQLQPC